MASQRYVLDFGSANAGGAPTFASGFFKRLDTLADVTAPTIHEIGSGEYYFDWDWSLVTGYDTISFKVILNGVEVADTISGVVSSALTPGNTGTGGYQQVGRLIARAAVQSGLLALNSAQIIAYDPFTSTDPNILQLLEFLNTIGDELNSEHNWTQLKREYTFTTVAGTLLYDLPADFHEFCHESGWNRSVRLPLLGPLTSNEVQAIKAQLTGVVLNVPWRQHGNQFEFPLSPPTGQTIAFEYISSNWVSTDGTTINADAVTTRTDWVLYDPLLILRALKLRWAEAKGFDTAVLQKQYDRALEHAIVRTTSARTLRLGGGKIIDRYLDRPNVPPSGFGY